MATHIQNYRKPAVALLLLLAFGFPLSKSAATVLLTLSYAGLLVLVVANREFRKTLVRRLDQPLLLPFLTIVAVALAGLFLTENRADGMGIVGKLVNLPLIYLMVSILYESASGEAPPRRVLELALLAFIAGTLALDCIGLLTYLGVIGGRGFSLPVFPMHVHHIWFANLNAVAVYAAVALMLFGAVRGDRPRTALLVAFLPIAAFSILFSISRTAWIGLLVTGVILAFYFTARKKVFFLALALVAAGCLVSYQFSPIVHERVNDAVADIVQYADGSRETSLGWRFLMWKGAITMFLSNPLFGVGTGDYVLTMKQYIASGAYPDSLLQFNQPHNLYLFSLATNGIAGLAALLFLFFVIFRHSFRRLRAGDGKDMLAFLALATGIHFMVGGLTDSFFNIQILRYVFAFIMGVSVRKFAAGDGGAQDFTISGSSSPIPRRS